MTDRSRPIGIVPRLTFDCPDDDDIQERLNTDRRTSASSTTELLSPGTSPRSSSSVSSSETICISYSEVTPVIHISAGHISKLLDQKPSSLPRGLSSATTTSITAGLLKAESGRRSPAGEPSGVLGSPGGTRSPMGTRLPGGTPRSPRGTRSPGSTRSITPEHLSPATWPIARSRTPSLTLNAGDDNHSPASRTTSLDPDESLCPPAWMSPADITDDWLVYI